ncbi:MAG TPA: GNAT family N-acetyltransferase [Fimbriimonadaceae bacterium]|nr:GNAT family N-acetyltransferase [Fimbriimonadaceae bacterium]
MLRIGDVAEEGAVEGLVDLLGDAVEDGASVGFLAPLDRELAAAYWREKIREARCGERILLGAWSGERLVGTVQLAFPAQENGKSRAEVQRLLVHTAARRRGIGRALMERLEEMGRGDGRKVLFLNTRAGDPPEKLYLGLGYTLIGQIPDFAMNPDGTLNTTSIMYKQL